MKLEKAIEIKKHYQYVLPKESYPDLITADNISIEALLYVQRNRLGDVIDPDALLPGETKE